jgi:DNA-binding transcriptional ArsR family regulator
MPISDGVADSRRVANDALRALAEPRRREILQLVADQELAAGEIAAAFDVTRPAVSQHLTVLKSAACSTSAATARDGSIGRDRKA